MGAMPVFRPGDKVELSDSRAATVRYSGSTHFADGDWIGVELEDATGKNDGSVQGERYFECPSGHGMFIRPSAATVLRPASGISARSISPRKAIAAAIDLKATGDALRGSNESSRRRSIAPVLDHATLKRQNMNSVSPSPSARVSRIGSPTKQTNSSAGSSGTSTPARKSMLPPARPSRTSTTPLSVKSTRMSTTHLKSATTRQSLAPKSLATAQSRSSSSVAGRTNRKSDESVATSASASLSVDANIPRSAVPLTADGPSLATSNASATISTRLEDTPVLATDISTETQRELSSKTEAVSKRELDDLKTKLRMMEKRRMDDRERIKTLERLQEERDKFEGIIQKLQAKYQPQQQELIDLKKALQDQKVHMATFESQLSEHGSLMEVATLDKEMAEENAEDLRQELESLRQSFEELELEVSVLREENAEFEKQMSPEDRASQGWLQLEKTNERLREALIRLRDMTQEQETSFKDQISELESDAQEHAILKEHHAKARASLEETNSTLDELRQQLDVALGSEEMIEDLTERNLALTERIDEMKVVIDDLESLKELNDELESNHIETEKQLQEEIDFNESLLSEEAKKAALQDGVIQDLEYTVSRFRELVTNLQSDLEDMKASQQITETEANDLTSKSRAMMDLNMRLQTSASKTHVRAIDQEIGRMQAQESKEQLAIVQDFLPETFLREQGSIEALLRLRRIVFKSQLVQGSIRERTQRTPLSSYEEDQFCSADMCNSLVWVVVGCKRLISRINSCSLAEFSRLGTALGDLASLERFLDGLIDTAKKDDLRLESSMSELQRFISIMDHLIELYIDDSIENYPLYVSAQTAVIQSRLEGVGSTLSMLKEHVENLALSSDGETSAKELCDFGDKMEPLISQSRSIKVVIGKVARQVDEYQQRALSLDTTSRGDLQQVIDSSLDLFTSTCTFCTFIFNSTNDDARTFAEDETRLMVALRDSPVSMGNLSSKLQLTASHATSLHNLTINASNTVEIMPPSQLPPWQLLAQNHKKESSDQEARDKELGSVKQELLERNTTLVLRDRAIEEYSVKLEVLEKRALEATSRSDRIRLLEADKASLKQSEKEKVSQMMQFRAEIDRLETEQRKWQSTSSPNTVPTPAPAANASLIAQPLVGPAHLQTMPTSEASVLNAEIAALNSTIRYLRTRQYTTFTSRAHIYLQTPIDHTPAHRQRHLAHQGLSSEARAALKGLLDFTSQETLFNPVKLLPLRARKERLCWRPAAQTAQWQANRRKEEWTGWKEWRDDVAFRATRSTLRGASVLHIAGQIPCNAKEIEGIAVGQVEIVGENEVV